MKRSPLAADCKRIVKALAEPYSKAAAQYAADVLANKRPANVMVVLACERFARDMLAGAWLYDPNRAAHACAFVELLPHVKGKWARVGPGRAAELIKLEPWQVFSFCNLFGWIDDKGNRRFRQALIMVPRKNGKSIIAAGVGLYMGFADGEPGAEVYCGADTESQAWEVFRPAKKMVEKAGDFREEFEVKLAAKSLFTDEGSRFEPVIGNPGDGASPHCSITDEYHEHKTSDQLDTFITGMGAREQPLALVITTAGDNTAGPCFEFQLYAEDVLKGLITDDRLFAIIYAADRTDDWTDYKTWIKANPNYGVSVNPDYLEAQFRTAVERPAKRNILLTKHLNRWVSARNAYFDGLKWSDLASPDPIRLFYGRPAWLAMDLATKVDVAAVVLLTKDDAGRDRYFPFFYMPENRLDDPNNPNAARYAEWAAKGYVRLTPGDVIDFDYIAEDVKELLSHFEVEAVGFDPWQARHLANQLTADGAPMVEVGMTAKNLSEPMKELEAGILSGTLAHAGNPMFDWMVSNVVARADARDNVYPRKPDGQEHLKIDGAVAAIIAKGLSMAGDEPGGSINDWLSDPIVQREQKA